MISPPYSRLLLKDKLPCLSPHIITLCPAFLTAWQFLGNWIKADKGTTPFEIAHGMTLWEYADQNPAFNSLFKEPMASDSGMLNLAIRDCKPVFLGLGSLVDVEGAIGKVANTENVKFIGGDMFHSNPPADALLLKLTLHAYSDEECLKILKKCREAIPSDGGKVIIIDIVINKEKEEHQVTEAKLFFDMLMMVVVTGRERSERDWEKLFLEAGFRSYKILPLFGLRSLIKVYP
ncbi:hypothetical protein FEM48_Zijuj01G0034800 [Ziziphus jujuba var. spinosa]|uniref:O-methyltransferase C-terminal domain-containing protein n=1 Tax=Ziziphus jujuba var. spinosa TaxID=714518 RepID=A0A978VYW4_ZIZJJ|nr:hypothetical protein FEM48_Zijuj01G0034800 [Ziziphus jujuba var. spinosa]